MILHWLMCPCKAPQALVVYLQTRTQVDDTFHISLLKKVVKQNVNTSNTLPTLEHEHMLSRMSFSTKHMWEEINQFM